MATKEKKAQRRAVVLSELNRLSGLIAEHLDVDVPDVSLRANHDPELSQIMQLEAINGLLSDVLTSVGGQSDPSDLEGMTKAELLAKADELGVEVPRTAKKADIIDAVKGAR